MEQLLSKLSRCSLVCAMPNKRLHADAQTYAAFVGFAALHFTTKASPVRALVSRALCARD
ncbi:hypothetical protein LCGC14_0180880 [marine sediment metagenome]|uniref:Uncharacterized protein n=1 Tax=marine sediment metagenome TaxID=412755 RepID=A0A0F9UQ67_9ZZZZ